MKINFKAIKKQLYFLYLLLNENTDIGANRKQLFIQAVKENLSKSRRNNPLVLQLANELAAAMLIIEEQKAVIKELENNILELHSQSGMGVLDVWNILEAINEHDKSFHFPQPVTVRVMNPNDGLRYIEKEFNPRWIVCIHSISEAYYDSIPSVSDHKKPSYHRRMKRVIYKLENGKKTQFKHYLINDDNKLDAVSDIFDNMNRYLCVISKKFIVNVGFYDLVGDFLYLNEDVEYTLEVNKIPISCDVEIKGHTALNAFKKIKDSYISKIMFQKRVLCYKEDMAL
jgi:hypothetical protein